MTTKAQRIYDHPFTPKPDDPTECTDCYEDKSVHELELSPETARETWRVHRLPGERRDAVVCDSRNDKLICEATPEDAARIIREHNSHARLVDALKLFKAMDACSYELETMRRSGLFEQIDKALRLAGKE